MGLLRPWRVGRSRISEYSKNLQKNALNRNSQLSKSNALKQAGAFRAPVPIKKGWEAKYCKMQHLVSVQNDVVKNRGSGEFILKQIQPVLPANNEPTGQLIEKSIPKKIRLQERAAEVEEVVRMAGEACSCRT